MPAPPWAADALLVLLRWLHALATVAFLGTSLVYLFERVGAAEQAARVVRYRDIMDVTLVVLLATGAVLSFDRLSHGAGAAYAVVLAVKIIASVATFQLAFRWRRTGLAARARDGQLVLLGGAVVILLAAVLKGVFESGIRGSF